MKPSDFYAELINQHAPSRRITAYGDTPAGLYLVVKRERDDRSKIVFEEFLDQQKVKSEMFNDRRFGSLYEVIEIYNTQTCRLIFKEDWDA